MDTKEQGQGLNGIQYWNVVYPVLKERRLEQMKIRDDSEYYSGQGKLSMFDYGAIPLEEMAVRLCKELVSMKLTFDGVDNEVGVRPKSQVAAGRAHPGKL